MGSCKLRAAALRPLHSGVGALPDWFGGRRIMNKKSPGACPGLFANGV